MKNNFKFKMGVSGVIVCIIVLFISLYTGITSCSPNFIFCHLNNPIGAWSITICGSCLVGLVVSVLIVTDNIKDGVEWKKM